MSFSCSIYLFFIILIMEDNRSIPQLINDLAIPENKGQTFNLGWKRIQELAPEDAEAIKDWNIEGTTRYKTINGVEFEITIYLENNQP